MSVWGEHCPSVLHSKIHYVLKKVNNPTLQLNHHGKSQTSTARLIQACNGNERSSFLFSVHSTVHATGRAVGLRSDRAFCRPADRALNVLVAEEKEEKSHFLTLHAGIRKGITVDAPGKKGQGSGRRRCIDNKSSSHVRSFPKRTEKKCR